MHEIESLIIAKIDPEFIEQRLKFTINKTLTQIRPFFVLCCIAIERTRDYNNLIQINAVRIGCLNCQIIKDAPR